jgi:predicted murein hydrolase (TIGR00659 family)
MILYGLSLTIFAYVVALYISNRVKLALLNPILLTAIMIIGVLYLSPLSYEQYEHGASLISAILGPLVVVLAIPLYNNRHIMKKHYCAIIAGIIVGVLSSAISVIVLGTALGLEGSLIWSLLPKSITSPMAIEVADMIGGMRELTVVFVVFTGILGATISPLVFKLFRIKNDTAKGIGLGASSHGIGTAKAIEISDEAGAASSLSMIISGVATIILAIIIEKII